jgi:hypothetical protein
MIRPNPAPKEFATDVDILDRELLHVAFRFVATTSNGRINGGSITIRKDMWLSIPSEAPDMPPRYPVYHVYNHADPTRVVDPSWSGGMIHEYKEPFKSYEDAVAAATAEAEATIASDKWKIGNFLGARQLPDAIGLVFL